MTGGGYWTELAEIDGDTSMERDAVNAIAEHISEKAHSYGYAYGQDWSEFLSEITLQECLAIVTGEDEAKAEVAQ
jgi:hypothetical protein